MSYDEVHIFVTSLEMFCLLNHPTLSRVDSPSWVLDMLFLMNQLTKWFLIASECLNQRNSYETIYLHTNMAWLQRVFHQSLDLDYHNNCFCPLLTFVPWSIGLDYVFFSLSHVKWFKPFNHGSLILARPWVHLFKF